MADLNLMRTLKELVENVIASIYKKMMLNLRYYYELQNGRKYNDRCVFLVFAVGNTVVKKINVTRHAQLIKK